jgi:hypothetical protein
MSDVGVLPEALSRASGRGTGGNRVHLALLWLVGLALLLGCAAQHGGDSKPSWDYVPPVAAVPIRDEQEMFCKRVAEQVAGEPFDQPTRERMFADGYRQCMNFTTGIAAH